MSLDTILKLCPLVPVVVIQSEQDAVPLAEALLAGGIKTIEITLRSDAGLKAIEKVASQVPGIVTGAGTITKPAQLKQAQDAGAKFIVSPGLTAALAKEAQKLKAPLLPGVATASEVMQAQDWGIDLLKLFPAEQSGGTGKLKHFASVFPTARFCPTGGVSMANLAEYLAQKNVICVGGSWLTPAEVIAAKDWGKITQIARDSLAKCEPRKAA